MVFMFFWTQFKEFLVLILKLNFDVAKFLLKISYFARNFFWLFCSPQARTFYHFARRRRKFWPEISVFMVFLDKFGFSWFFHGFHGFAPFSWFSWFSWLSESPGWQGSGGVAPENFWVILLPRTHFYNRVYFFLAIYDCR